MFYVKLTDDLIGKRLGAPICDSSGRIILRKGVELTSTYIERLRNLGYVRIFIENELAPDIEVTDAISKEARVLAAESVRQVLAQVEAGLQPDVRRIQIAVDRIIDDIFDDSCVVKAIAVVRNIDDYTMMHSVNVAVLSIIIARSLGYPRHDLKDIGVGAILHDIGKAKLPRVLINKPGKLTDQEFEQVKRHTEYGFEILRKIFSINLSSAHIAYQHHERLDGSGYPRGLVGEGIHPWSRLAAVADVYDALTTDRPYRAAFRPDEAMAILHDNTGVQFEGRPVIHLIRRLAIYPAGTIVRLNNGYIGIVVRQTTVSSRPVVRVLADPDGLLTGSYELDLSQDETYHVCHVLPHFPRSLLDQLAR